MRYSSSVIFFAAAAARMLLSSMGVKADRSITISFCIFFQLLVGFFDDEGGNERRHVHAQGLGSAFEKFEAVFLHPDAEHYFLGVSCIR